MDRYYCEDCGIRFKKYYHYKGHIKGIHKRTPYIYYPNVYSILRTDRSGARLLDILKCYSYCRKHNGTYKGSIIDYNYFSVNGSGSKNLKDCIVLCKMLGIPGPIDRKSIKDKLWQKLHDDVYLNFDKNDNIFNKEFLEHLIESVKTKGSVYLKKTFEDPTKFIVSVHLRRGDVSPLSKWKFRYTPNSYYLELISIIKKKCSNAVFYVFSESDSFEPFDDFKKMGCIVKLDKDMSVSQTWIHMIKSDMILMSCGAFSVVPALFSKNTKIYIDNKYFPPLKNWVSGSMLTKKQFLENYDYQKTNIES